MNYYKILDGNKPANKWMPALSDNLIPCSYGYHLCRSQDLIEWLGGDSIYLAEPGDVIIVEDDKIVTNRVRLIKQLNWDARIARHFACDCAGRVLKYYEYYTPTDERVRECIKTAREFANGKATTQQLGSARSAAWSEINEYITAEAMELLEEE